LLTSNIVHLMVNRRRAHPLLWKKWTCYHQHKV